MLFAIYAKMIKAVYRLINPLHGQSHGWFSSFRIMKMDQLLTGPGTQQQQLTYVNLLHIHMKLSK